MTSVNRRDHLVSGLRAFARGRSGAAAVEFAALLPFMLAVYIPSRTSPRNIPPSTMWT
jgi:Flp pilus assembly protein TadG